MHFWRRAKAGLKLATLWGVASVAVNLAFRIWRLAQVLIVGGTATRRPYGGRFFVLMVVVYFGIGFIAGGIFAVLLATAERRRTVQTLSPARTAAWGALAAGVLAALPVYVINHLLASPGIHAPALTMLLFDLGEITTFAVLGAVGARATLAVAQRAAVPLIAAEESGLK